MGAGLGLAADMSNVVNLAKVRADKEAMDVALKRAARKLIRSSKVIIRAAYPEMTERQVHRQLKIIAATLASRGRKR